MAIGGLIAVPELQAEGPARLVGQTSGYFSVVFLRTGASMTVEQRQVCRYCLIPGTRVLVELQGQKLAGEVMSAPVRTDRSSGLITYCIRLDDGIEEELSENVILDVPASETPFEQLRTVSFHEWQPRFARAGTPKPPEPWGPQTFSAREQVLEWRDRSWSDTGGVIGLSGARVVPLPHQLVTARRILADRRIRYLLADEVGLGKTIEAGLVMQSLLAMNPKLRVLIVVPGALSSQWFLEMYVKFGGRQFTLLDNERLASFEGSPWDQQFVIVSSRALEELGGVDAIRFAKSKWDLLIVDECHRMAPGGVLYKRIASASKKVPHLLLLSATPSRHHAEAYLGLLHLLQPEAYPLEDVKGFQQKWERAVELGTLLHRTRQDEDRESVGEAWLALLPGDRELQRAVNRYCEDESTDARESLMTYVREHYQLDRRVIRHRRQVLQRLSASTGIDGLALGERGYKHVTYKIDAAEQAVRDALADYSASLLDHYAPDEDPPPRLVHWLIQLHLASVAHPRVLERLLAMRSAVAEEPEEFEEYRQRAKKGETIEGVLRGDLSEAEQASHIAISASCHVHAKLEAKILPPLRSAVDGWVKRIPARDRKLVDALNKFWDEFPQEKVLVFTGHAIGVNELAEYLGTRVGSEHIETFGAHQDPLEREAAANKFKNNDNCWVLVSDALGGEGRNFQFVSLIVHHDLPWSIAAVEQRIGRVDRLGRDGEVPSWVIRPQDDDAVDAAWAEALQAAVGVFTASSSGLEFVAGRIEREAAIEALRRGGAGIRERIEELTGIIDDERQARDEAEDELYLEGLSAYEEAADLARSVADARVPVSALCLWLRGMGGHVRRDEDPPRPFSLRGRSADKPVEGVFRRDAALSHEGLSFFARGHDMIDRLIDDAVIATWCRASAWRRKPIPTCRKWEGIRVGFELDHDLSGFAAAGLPLEILRRLYTIVPPFRQIHFIDVNGTVVEDEETLEHLRKPFDGRAGDSCLSAKTSRETWMRPLLEGRLQQVVGWQDRIKKAWSSVAELQVNELNRLKTDGLAKLRPALSAQVEVAIAQAANAARRLGTAHQDTERLQEEAFDEQEQQKVLLQALENAELRVASVAYLVVA